MKTPLEVGARLSKADCPDVVDPVLHQHYRGITGYLSFLVTMTRCDLEFAYAKLSKFVQCPGEAHLKAAERVLQYLKGTYMDGITYSDPGPAGRNVLKGWVDSDYVSDPDTRKSVTGTSSASTTGRFRGRRNGRTVLHSAPPRLNTWQPVWQHRRQSTSELCCKDLAPHRAVPQRFGKTMLHASKSLRIL